MCSQTWPHNHHARVIAAYMQVNMRAPGKSPPSLFKADAWYDQPNFRSQVHIGGNIVGVCRLDRLDGRKLVVKMELRDRNIVVKAGDFSTVPQFLEIFQEVFGGSFTGRKATENMIQAARHVYERITEVHLPETTKLPLHIREHIERMISGDSSNTRCRRCHPLARAHECNRRLLT